MSEVVTVKSFSGGNDWTSDDGKIALTFYECVFDRNGSDFEAQWGKKQGTGDPTTGEEIEGEFFQKDGKWRFRKASKPQGSTGSGGSTSSASHGSKSKEWRPESQFDPEKVARIGRAHAQGMAIQTLTAMGIFESKSADQLTSKLKHWIDFFEADVNAAAQKAAQARGANTGNGSAQDSGDPTPGAQETQSNAEHLSKLLEEAGFDLAQVTVVQRYIETNFDNERRTKVEAALLDISKVPKVFDQLKKETEAWAGEPLPVHDPASTELPF